ncbi:hypothetical protein TUM3794_20340 [Shewanella colwelliana]|uniref:Uncharacterized protein n=1 Tax=Shewanella colwelliana TaxID=23 RepID=A0ABQ4P0H4_SHECO|nr:hypothetical protein [Shewanella colwelliana]GIU41000.1 hypothetical protein TUM3794_20340 [Shewanella colwelliana]
MSVNPPRLSHVNRIWHSKATGLSVPKLGNVKTVHSAQNQILIENSSFIADMLQYGIEKEYCLQSEVAKALAIKDQTKQLVQICELMTNKIWNPFASKVQTIIETQHQAIKQVIASAINDWSDSERESFLKGYDDALSYRNEMVNLKFEVNHDARLYGDFYENTLSPRVTFNSAYNTNFDLELLRFKPRLKPAFYYIVESIMPYQFEAPILELTDYSSNWFLEETFGEEEELLPRIKPIYEYINKHPEYTIEELVEALKLDDEVETFLTDYGVESLINKVELEGHKEIVAKYRAQKHDDVMRSMGGLVKRHPALQPLLDAISYFKNNIGKVCFPFENQSDTESEFQLFFSYGHHAESEVVDAITEDFWSRGEESALGLVFSQDCEQFFHNYAISSCLVALMFTVLNAVAE